MFFKMFILDLPFINPLLAFGGEDSGGEFSAGIQEPDGPAAPFQDEDDFISNPGDDEDDDRRKKKGVDGEIEEESLEELALKDDLDEENEEDGNY